MKLKDFKIVVCLLFPIVFFAQNKVSGKITDFFGEPIPNVEIFNKITSELITSSASGTFVINLKENRKNDIVFFSPNHKVVYKTYAGNSNFENVEITLEPIEFVLSELTLSQKRERLFTISTLRDIEETAIFAGKKTEVIALEKITANKAVNNTRQIFAQVVGLTMNESTDGGLQLSIGGRGLNPNRTSNFNTRQNGYDISADVLGYPESYYATPTEALEEIQIIRGAASLQYGTQFGGMVNFKIKSPSDKPIELLTRTTLGSFNLYTNFTSLSGTKGKFSYYTFYNYKQGNGFRPNSNFEASTLFTNFNYQFTENTSLHFDYTYFDYLAKQPGGLTDFMFAKDPTQSNRDRNYFDINWNLFALRLKHHFNNDADFSLQLFGLNASRKALGYRSNRVSNPDTPGTVRDLIIGDFVNWGAEARYLKRYQFFSNENAFLIGAKYYQSNNTGIQGPGSSGNDANFSLATAEFPSYGSQSDFKFPNLNLSLFGENIIKISPNFSITPGFRFENIKTQANGYYRSINTDLAGNVISDIRIDENVVKERNFLLLGIGVSYKTPKEVEVYANISQNYRSVTFSDIRTVNPSQIIDENIKDENGFTTDIGFRGKISNAISFDASVYALYYNDKIGEYLTQVPNSAAVVRYRDNIGTALTYGFESLIDWNINSTFFKENKNFKWNVFSNVALTNSEYLKSDISNIKGKKVEFVPNYNLKFGTGLSYKNWKSSVQYTYVSSQFTNAENTPTNKLDNTFGVFGEIPTYQVLDFSASYQWKFLKIESGINNVLNTYYFTKRATGYPGPGIIPSEPRVFYTTLEFKF